MKTIKIASCVQKLWTFNRDDGKTKSNKISSSFCKEDILKTAKTAEKSSVSQLTTCIIADSHRIVQNYLTIHI
jgi:hypothetical protein